MNVLGVLGMRLRVWLMCKIKLKKVLFLVLMSEKISFGDGIVCIIIFY